MRARVRLDDGGRQNAHLIVRAQNIEVMDAIAEAVLVAVNLGRGRDGEMEGPATLVLVTDRLHAHLRNRFFDRLGVGEPAFVLDFKDHGFGRLFKNYAP